jgi:hypothetical protein
MNDQLALWSAVVGFVLPPVLALVMRSGWSSQVQGLVACAACLVAAAGTVWFQGDLGHGQDLVTSFLLIFTAAIGTSRLYWKPSGIAPSIEAKLNSNRSERH